MKYYLRYGLVIAAFIASIITITQLLPPPFDQFGFYSGDSVQDNMDFPLKHSGVDSCFECHEQVITKWSISIHNNVSCESCHGAAAQHVETNSSLGLIVSLDQLCILCHKESISKSEEFLQINFDDHWTNITLFNTPNKNKSICIFCHEPTSKTFKGPMIPHLFRGITNCTSCHGVQYNQHFPTNHRIRSDETCLACHNQNISINNPKILHSLEDRLVCSSCHGIDTELQYPEDHFERSDDVCSGCHSTEVNIVDSFQIPLILHSLEDRLVCSSCHGNQVLQYPDNHVGRYNNECLDCHNADISYSVPEIVHPLDGYSDCFTCHVIQNALQYPNDHIGLSEDVCLNCHSADREIHIPKILHSLVGRLNCVNCHGSDSILEYPENHFEWSDDVCIGCHSTDVVIEINQNISLILHSLEDRLVCSSCHGIDTELQYPEDHFERSDNICLICHEVNTT